MLVGALLVSADPACAVGVIFFNNVGYLACAATAYGVIATLAHLGRAQPGIHRVTLRWVSFRPNFPQTAR
jgi:4-hydroxyproline epimerase